jgi:hypothetical protein
MMKKRFEKYRNNSAILNKKTAKKRKILVIAMIERKKEIAEG